MASFAATDMKTLELAKMCQEIYTASPTAWDHYWVRGAVNVAHRKVGQFDVIVFRGSATLEDWKRDLDGWPNSHPKLGYVHSGFLKNMDEVAAEVSAVLLQPYLAITGHSLGAARAMILAALLRQEGVAVDKVAVFGCPRPGFSKLARIVQQSGALVEAYRNRDDPVTYVPWFLGMYKHPFEPFDLDIGEKPNEVRPICDHFMEKYVEGIAAQTK